MLDENCDYEYDGLSEAAKGWAERNEQEIQGICRRIGEESGILSSTSVGCDPDGTLTLDEARIRLDALHPSDDAWGYLNEIDDEINLIQGFDSLPEADKKLILAAAQDAAVSLAKSTELQWDKDELEAWIEDEEEIIESADEQEAAEKKIMETIQSRTYSWNGMEISDPTFKASDVSTAAEYFENAKKANTFDEMIKWLGYIKYKERWCASPKALEKALAGSGAEQYVYDL